MKRTPPPIVKLKVSHLSKEGKGIATWLRGENPSATVEIPFTMPGDEGVVQIVKHHRKRYFGQWIELTRPAVEREQPLCRHFSSCGGCLWQHIPYGKQLTEKESSIRNCLEPYLDEHTVWHSIIPCTPPWHYRNKMELSFSSDKQGNRYLGLILQGSRGLVFNIQECHLCDPWMMQAVQAVRGWWEKSGLEAYHFRRNSGILRTLTLRSGQRTGDRLVMLTVSANGDDPIDHTHLQSFVEVLKDTILPQEPSQKLSIFLRVQQTAKGSPTQFYEMQLFGPDHIREIISLETHDEKTIPLEFKISPVAFFQPNTRQAEIIYSKAIQMAQPTKESIVYDLYCGTGTLGICMANLVSQVTGIEISPYSVLDGRENLIKNGLTNMTIHQGDVGQLLPVLASRTNQKVDIVMVDPPRSGLDKKAIEHILLLKAPKIVYISCNPNTQADNLESFIKEGYRIEAVQPVDQFPHTNHVENIIILGLEPVVKR